MYAEILPTTTSLPTSVRWTPHHQRRSVSRSTLSNPTIFDFDPVFKLDAVLSAQAHPLFALLRIFLSGGLDDLHASATRARRRCGGIRYVLVFIFSPTINARF